VVRNSTLSAITILTPIASRARLHLVGLQLPLASTSDVSSTAATSLTNRTGRLSTCSISTSNPSKPPLSRTVPKGHCFAFVDHSTPGSNNRVTPETAVDIVIDHHPADAIEAQFVDHREDSGATATILTEYVRALEIDLDATLATALMFAIRRETLNFLRGTTRAEYDAARFLHDDVDNDLLRKLSNPSVSGAALDAIATAINNRMTKSAVLISRRADDRARCITAGH